MQKKQQGVVILISVIMLFILAGLSITLLSNSVSQQMTTHEAQDIALAKQAANNAVESGKKAVLETWAVGNTECNTSPCTCGSGLPCVWTAATFSSLDFTQMSASSWNNFGTAITASNPNVAASPQYIIVDLGCDAVSSRNRYLVVGRGIGGEDATIAFSQEILSVPINQNNASSSSTTFVNAFVDSTLTSSFTMAPSTMSGSFFVNNTASLCPTGTSSYAHCEMNCAGSVRVMAWTFDQGCVPTYGPWAQGTNASAVTLTLGGTSHTISCVP
jgi:Tfp pilus assembly protein PilX